MDQSQSEHQLAGVHRHSGWMFLFTTGLMMLLAMQVAGGGVIAILIFLAGSIAALGWFQRASWGIKLKLPLMLSFAVGCIGFGLLEFSNAMNGSEWGWVQGMLLGFIAFSTLRRARMIRHPLFQAWYRGESMQLSGVSIAVDEMLARCPSCASILAIRPAMLGVDDTCPQCGGQLISDAARAAMEEE